MALLKLIYLLYFGGIGFWLISSFSRFCFSKEKMKHKLISLIKDLACSPFFILSLFSKEGRKKLSTFININK